MKSNFGIIIQARLSSTRLPKKIVLKIEDEITFLDILLTRLTENFPSVKIVIATSTNKADDALLVYGEKYNLPIFRGSENNVLKRFIDCAEFYKIDTVIRVCSDNPYLDLEEIKKLVDYYQQEDYLSFKIGDKPSILTHYGFFTEIVKLSALKTVLGKKNHLCLEHVTNCIHSDDEGEFNVRFIEKTIANKDIRCTLDTVGDYENLKTIYFDWYKGLSDINFRLEELIIFIELHENLEHKMREEIKNNTK